jgi:phosphoglucomutase
MDSKIKDLAVEWTKEPYDESLREEIVHLLDTNDNDELTDRFYKNLEFGTGGLRGKIGAGTNRMNIHTVGIASQGLSNYILSSKEKIKSIVIAYDSRNMSREFAEYAASIFAANTITTYIFDELTPTPLCSFAIRELEATAGVVITASHNPAQYNGYKVFWNDGAQIISPQDKEIISEIRKIQSIETIKTGNFDELCSSGKIITIGESIRSDYFKKLRFEVLEKIDTSPLKIIYSPLHGTGYRIIPDLLKSFGFSELITVPEQTKPDGNFPTVKYPNPEERDAMSLSIDLGKKENADIIIATDPDSDRIGVGVKSGDDFTLLNGNHTAVLLANYMLLKNQEQGTLPSNSKIIKTIITTELLAKIASSYNVDCDNVLTGFKWIGALMKKYEISNSGSFIFGCEESYGYLPIDYVRDKDAVSTSYFICEMAHYYKQKGMSLIDVLFELYKKHGIYSEDMHYIVLEGAEGAEQIQKIMNDFRTNPPESLNQKNLVLINDFSTLKSTRIDSNEQSEINGFPTSNVIQWFFENGFSFTIRPSGTEPKIKFYISVNSDNTDNIPTAKLELEEEINQIKKFINTKIESIISA